MLKPETVLQSRYRIVRVLGRGGMGAVYEAVDERLHRRVALKENLIQEEELRLSFEREARLLANLRHATLPKVLDHFTEENGLFLVMEFIPGDDLAAMLELEGRFPPERVLPWAEQILGALEYLHGLEPPVVHRDIKPSNLKLVSGDQIVLLDFGLAKGTAGEMTVHAERSIYGYSPNYSSLEQMQGVGTDERSDFYALGSTLYHLLTGVRPPDALTRATALLNGEIDPLRPPTELTPEVSPVVSAALMRAMAVSRDQRPRNAREMRRDLHDMVSAVSATVPIIRRDQTTRVEEADEATVVSPPIRKTRQVVIDVPEETLVATRERGARWPIWLGLTAIAGVSFLAAVLYPILTTKRQTAQQLPAVQRPSPRVSPSPSPSMSPSPSPSPSPSASPTPAGTDQTAPPTFDQLQARDRLMQGGVPFTEDSFLTDVRNGDTSKIDLFLAGGMSPDVKDQAGRTALISAAAQGSDNISRKLLRGGANANAQDATGTTALMEAAARGHHDTVNVLLERGANPNLQDSTGQTALMRAVAAGREDTVRMLLSRGARADLKDKSGRDAFAIAQATGRMNMIDLLQRGRQ